MRGPRRSEGDVEGWECRVREDGVHGIGMGYKLCAAYPHRSKSFFRPSSTIEFRLLGLRFGREFRREFAIDEPPAPHALALQDGSYTRSLSAEDFETTFVGAIKSAGGGIDVEGDSDMRVEFSTSFDYALSRVATADAHCPLGLRVTADVRNSSVRRLASRSLASVFNVFSDEDHGNDATENSLKAVNVNRFAGVSNTGNFEGGEINWWLRPAADQCIRLQCPC
ncbi:hypothetical protein NMY22_g4174 [Coprinellus aureogranulatus]|nr:hypothetical protein NMY22_g4174 [Coprinellus aureogranulatus]